MCLDLDRFMQDGFGIVVGVQSPFVRRLCRHLLADDDDRQQDQLQKRLCNPRDDGGSSALDRITGTELDLSSMMGLTMVIGIVTEVAVFYFAELDTSGEIGVDELMHAAKMRLRPILMTSSIAILALMPLALGLGAGSEMQRPLAITIISGLVVAVPLVLLGMPSLFLCYDRLAQRWRRRVTA